MYLAYPGVEKTANNCELSFRLDIPEGIPWRVDTNDPVIRKKHSPLRINK